MGRDKQNEQRVEHYTKMVRNMMETPAWRALPPTAQALYPWLRLEWRGPKANNNGKVSLSVRHAAERMGVSLNTAAKAFHALQAKGFIVVTQPARLGVSGDARATTFELTEITLPHSEKNTGRRLYQGWNARSEYPVQRSMANNPRGVNGRAKNVVSMRRINSEPHHQN
jgi:DNA-binding transcriptional MocR family regulator